MKRWVAILRWFLSRPSVRPVVMTSALGLVIAGLYALLAPKWYEAKLAIIPAAPSKPPGGMLGAIATELPIDLNAIGGSGAPDAERIHAVLKSRTVMDAVIKKFGLIDRYKEDNIEGARKKLWRNCSTKVDKKPGVVTLTCEDKDPAFVQSMTAYFGEIGNEVFRHISAAAAREEREFLEHRLKEAHAEVLATSGELRDFQEKHKLIDLSEQSKAVVSAMAQLKGEMLSKELQLSYLHSFASSEEVTANQLRKQLSLMRAKMKSLEESAVPEGSTAAGGGTQAKSPAQEEDSGLFPPAMVVPQLRFQLEQLYRAQKVQETLFLLLTQRYEMARVNEARDTSAFQILDEPAFPTHKSRPQRLEVLALGLFLGALTGFIWLLIRKRAQSVVAQAELEIRNGHRPASD